MDVKCPLTYQLITTCLMCSVFILITFPAERILAVCLTVH